MQDRGRSNQEAAAPSSRKQSGKGGDHGAVAPADPVPWCASLQHGHLMAQDEDLDLVGGVGAGVKHHPAQQLREHLVDQLHPSVLS
jgi:hypothetical protein